MNLNNPEFHNKMFIFVIALLCMKTSNAFCGNRVDCQLQCSTGFYYNSGICLPSMTSYNCQSQINCDCGMNSFYHAGFCAQCPINYVYVQDKCVEETRNFTEKISEKVIVHEELQLDPNDTITINNYVNSTNKENVTTNIQNINLNNMHLNTFSNGNQYEPINITENVVYKPIYIPKIVKQPAPYPYPVGRPVYVDRIRYISRPVPVPQLIPVPVPQPVPFPRPIPLPYTQHQPCSWPFYNCQQTNNICSSCYVQHCISWCGENSACSGCAMQHCNNWCDGMMTG